MKQLVAILAILMPFLIAAQTNEGEIVYSETVQFKFDIPDISEEAKAKLPTSQTYEKTLYFNAESSLYKDMDEEDQEEEFESDDQGEGMHFKMVIMRPDNRLHKNLVDYTKTEMREFFGKKFLISGDLTDYNWKLTGEQKTILDYTCQKAVLQDTSRTLVAWFTPQILVSSGPGEFGKLPGMILEIDINEGESLITASKVKLQALPEDAIVAPKKGKSVTQEEFDQIVEEKTKEMAEEMGGSGGQTMHIKIGQ